MNIDERIRAEIIATVDKLNKYLDGNATRELIMDALQDLYVNVIKDEVKQNKGLH